jgi:hypothetical protein
MATRTSTRSPGNSEERVGGTKDEVQLTALRFINEHLGFLIYESRADADSLLSTVFQGKGNVVFYFGLNETGLSYVATEPLIRLLLLLDGHSPIRSRWSTVASVLACGPTC